MTTIMPQGELVRKAATYIEEERRNGKNLPALFEEAAMRFNLSPKEDEMLRDFFRSQSVADAANGADSGNSE